MLHILLESIILGFIVLIGAGIGAAMGCVIYRLYAAARKRFCARRLSPERRDEP